MFSAIFKSQFPEGIPKAELKINTEEELIAVIERVVKKGEDINAEQNRNKMTLLHLAVAKGYVKAVKLLLDNKANVNVRNITDATPLHDAALEGKIEMVKVLIANGADLNAVSDYLSTPLHIAASRGKVEIAKLLLENGADVNAKDKVGITPLTAAMTLLKYEHLMKGSNTTPEKQRKITEILRSYGGKE
jgi:ankyrin repeat protein